MDKFKGKVVLVTGASRGIGKAIALEFGKEGASVVVNYSKSKGKAEEVAKQIDASGGIGFAAHADVSKEADVKAMVGAAIEKFGKIDILVNNAGIVTDKPFEERTVEDWHEVMEVNLIGPFITSQILAPMMKKNGWGRIINISSSNAFGSFSPESVDYDAAKAGLVSLTHNLAKAFAPEVLVNCVAPGWIDTDMNSLLPADFLKSEIDLIYVKRIGDPKEIAMPVLFFASDDASFITGQSLIVNGGTY